MTALDLSQPRTVGQIIEAGWRVFARWPLLFLFVTAIILIPYGALTVLVTNTKHVSEATLLILGLADIAIVNPFIAALQMQALIDIGEGRSPALRDVVARGLRVLPVVAAADIVAGIAEVVGAFFFVVPGLIAAVRLAVAAPVAATEQVAWPDAIRRSVELTRGNSWRVFGLLVLQGVITTLVAGIVGASAIAVVIAGALLAIVAQAFCTLLINLLYFDLRAREFAAVASL